jgi:hypothetical protein
VISRRWAVCMLVYSRVEVVDDDGKRKEEIGDLIRLHSHSALFQLSSFSPQQRARRVNLLTGPDLTGLAAGTVILPQSLHAEISRASAAVSSWFGRGGLFFEKTSRSRRPLLRSGLCARHDRGVINLPLVLFLPSIWRPPFIRIPILLGLFVLFPRGCHLI